MTASAEDGARLRRSSGSAASPWPGSPCHSSATKARGRRLVAKPYVRTPPGGRQQSLVRQLAQNASSSKAVLTQMLATAPASLPAPAPGAAAATPGSNRKARATRRQAGCSRQGQKRRGVLLPHNHTVPHRDGLPGCPGPCRGGMPRNAAASGTETAKNGKNT